MEITSSKVCIKCGFEKKLEEFYFLKNKRCFRNKCKKCCIDDRKLYYEKNKIKVRLKAKNNQKEYRATNKNKINAYKFRKNELRISRRKTDSVFKLGDNISSLLRISFKSKGHPKRSKSVEILGCSIIEFKVHLEKQFEPWMNWDNHGVYNKNKPTWQLDHKVPVSSAKTEEDMIRLNHFTNFQPLESMANMVKSNKY